MGNETPRFFPAPEAFRAWLEENHASTEELWVGYYKKGTGRPSITWPESVDEALCWGWIDGLRRSIDEESYMIRFTPRRVGSTWSAVNLAKAEELIRAGRMRESGRRKYEERDEERTRRYSYERENATLPPEYEKRLRGNADAWTWYRSQPDGYRRIVAHWIMSAKQEATRIRRLGVLIESSAAGLRVPPMR